MTVPPGLVGQMGSTDPVVPVNELPVGVPWYQKPVIFSRGSTWNVPTPKLVPADHVAMPAGCVPFCHGGFVLDSCHALPPRAVPRSTSTTIPWVTSVATVKSLPRVQAPACCTQMPLNALGVDPLTSILWESTAVIPSMVVLSPAVSPATGPVAITGCL